MFDGFEVFVHFFNPLFCFTETFIRINLFLINFQCLSQDDVARSFQFLASYHYWSEVSS